MTFSLPGALFERTFGVVDEVAMDWSSKFCAPSCELPR
jgi:hypothetical protein